MATYIVHILMIGKVEIKNFSVSKGIFGFLLQNASLSSPLISYDFSPNLFGSLLDLVLNVYGK